MSLVMFNPLAILVSTLVAFGLDTIPQALKLGLLVFGGFVGPIGLIANFYSDRPIGA
jgi:hypothetical protein